ncbi:MAG TPA: hypothetical protein VNV87_07630 [Acidimicrobiales bacterium]|jgi:hypothetical protein|nr:hypothetical protein [Acidimicrobiales bacterium]
MSRRRSEGFGLLRWYPPGWRERYGEEFAALMEDTLGNRPPTRRLRLTTALTGLRERGRETGVVGDSVPPVDRARAGSLLVLCAWAAFVVAGSSFAKLSEGFGLAGPTGTASVSSGAYRSVMVVAIVACLVVAAGMAIAVPAFLRFLRGGGWPLIRRHVVRALIASGVGVSALAVLVGLAHTLTSAQRDGQLVSHPAVWYYEVAFIATMLLLAVALLLWTAAAVVTARRLDLTGTIVSAEALLAATAAAAMVLMTAATAVWWGSTASSTPWFLQGAPAGAAGSPLNIQLAATMVLMLAASILAGYGASRVARSGITFRTGPG